MARNALPMCPFIKKHLLYSCTSLQGSFICSLFLAVAPCFVLCCANIANAISLCPAVHCAQLCWALSCCAKITDRHMYSVHPRKENSIATTTTTTTEKYKQTNQERRKEVQVALHWCRSRWMLRLHSKLLTMPIVPTNPSYKYKCKHNIENKYINVCVLTLTVTLSKKISI